jgi:hypothetical protein
MLFKMTLRVGITDQIALTSDARVDEGVALAARMAAGQRKRRESRDEPRQKESASAAFSGHDAVFI